MESELIDSCLAGDLQCAGRLSDTKIPSELLDDPTALTYARTKLDADPQYRAWSIRAIILPANQTMVGHIGFHSCPDPDDLHPFALPAVEFGYHVFSQYRGRGYATEAAHAVMDWAWATFGIRHFIVCRSTGQRGVARGHCS
jgi:[ribosomal protein S5]-alanine N-acetyltransferase